MTEFAALPSGKVQCTVCGRRGFPLGSWRRRCEQGHPYECTTCGRRFTSASGLTAHQAPRRPGGRSIGHDLPKRVAPPGHP